MININFGMLFCIVPLVASMQAFAINNQIQLLNDEELSDIHGQALMSLTYISPSDAENKMQGQNTGFYKLGMEAEVKLNANINKLQLGCGGDNGAGGCDIDIDNLSLSGISDTRTGRAGSSAVLTNPFVEFAIKNPGSASTREVVGIRLSSEKIVGLLSTGTNNEGPNGINSFSGYMKVNGQGEAKTKSGTFGLAKGEVVNTNANINIFLCTTGCGSAQVLNAGYGFNSSKNTGIIIPSMKVPFQIKDAVVSGNRINSAIVKANATIPEIAIKQDSGQLGVSLNTNACVLFFVCVKDTFFKMDTKIQNLKANINFEEALGYIHNLPISSSAYLGLQTSDLHWPGAVEVAKKGWWMSLQDPINLGDITPASELDISSVYPQFAQLLGAKLSEPQYKISVTTGDGLSALFGSGISKTISPIDLSGQSVSLDLKNLKLAAQEITPNCYGSLKFC